MAHNPIWLQQLVYQLPGLLVYTLGLILALVYWRRCPGAALMTILGCGLLFLTTIGYTVVYAALREQMHEGGMTNEQFGRMMSILGLASSCARAIGLALVVVAVFVGRGHSPQAPQDADA